MRAIKRIAAITGLSALLFGALSLNAAAASATWHSCTVKEVIDYSNRISVLCTNSITFGSNVVNNAAIPVTDVAKAERFMAAANAGLLTGTIFWVDLPSSSSTNVSGCLASNCRTPAAFGLGK